MFCSHCGKELTPEQEVCPQCGQPVEKSIPEEVQENACVQPEAVAESEPAPEAQAEATPIPAPAQAPKAKPNVWMYIAIAACCAVAVLLAFVIWQGMGGSFTGAPTTATTAPVQTTAPVETTVPVDLGTYQGTEEEILAAADKVVATAGEHTLTNRQLQVYYWSEFYNFVEQNGDYLSYYGLDYTKPLNAQTIPNGSMTWEQYFVDLALNCWHRYLVLGEEAAKADFKLNEEIQTALDGLEDTVRSTATSYGYADAAALLQVDYGVGADLQTYMDYTNKYYVGKEYYSSIYNSQQPTREEVSAYFDENAESFSTNYGITKDSGYLVDVRHILLQPEGETDATTGYITATDDQWEAGRAAAQKILDDGKAGEATEEAFAKLANEHSTDGGSNTTGGLYTSVMKGQMVEAFDAWIFDAGRQSGDTGLVKTEFGYHIMYFVKTGEDVWYTVAYPELVQKLAQEKLTALLEAVPMETEEAAIVLDSAVLGSVEEQQQAATAPTDTAGGETDPTGETAAPTASAEDATDSSEASATSVATDATAGE